MNFASVKHVGGHPFPSESLNKRDVEQSKPLQTMNQNLQCPEIKAESYWKLDQIFVVLGAGKTLLQLS